MCLYNFYTLTYNHKYNNIVFNFMYNQINTTINATRLFVKNHKRQVPYHSDLNISYLTTKSYKDRLIILVSQNPKLLTKPFLSLKV